MEKIEWDNQFNINISEIDHQHQILVKTLNDAQFTLAEDESLENLSSITEDLLSYALYHFDTEEDLMSKYKYDETKPDEYNQHIKQHRDFSSKVVEIRESIKNGKMIHSEELIDFLKNWLINHINKTDKKLGIYIDEQKV